MKTLIVLFTLVICSNNLFSQTKLPFSKDVFCRYNDEGEYKCTEQTAFAGNHILITDDKIVKVYGKSNTHYTFYIKESRLKSENIRIYDVTDRTIDVEITYDKDKKTITFDYGGDETEVYHLK
jgi:hypothetical protein